MSQFDRYAPRMPTPAEILPGRTEPMRVPEVHFVSGARVLAPFPSGMERAVFAMGCFWGAERCFWSQPGVYCTSVGYAGGSTPNPTYREVCCGRSGHTEVVQVIYDPALVSYDDLLKLFWENHDPTQGMRQGNDVGTQYRSGIYTYAEAHCGTAEASKIAYGKQLAAAGFGAATTEIIQSPKFYYAEAEHQQYLAKNPGGYCGLGGTGVGCPIGVMPKD